MLKILAKAEAGLTLQQRFRIAVARSMRLLAKKVPFDESEHPRDEDGKFTEGGGGTDVAERPPQQRPAREREPEPGQRLTSNAIIADAGEVKFNSKKVQDVAKQINARAGKILKEELGIASIDLDNRSDETDDFVAGVIAQELKDGLSNGKSAADWYDSSMKQAMATADKLYPGMATDPDQRFAYTAALAISSQGEVVESTVRLADQAYRHFAEHGKFPTDIQAADPNIVLNLKKVNAFIDKLGVAKTREMFDQQFTVRDLKAATGIGVSGMGMDDMVYGSAVLGPKIGQGFYQNLNGNFAPITMDMWFMRAWGRVTNTGIGTPDMEPMYARLDAALEADGRKVPKSVASKKTIAREINAQHEKDYLEHKADYKTGKRRKSELVYASERIVLSADGAMVEQPRGVAHRRWMTSVFHRAIDKLNAEGMRISPASAQATWWWPEQVLYDALGARVRETDMDYGKALKNLAHSRGIKQFDYRKGLGFVPWTDDPDPPDYMTDAEIEAMAERAAKFFGIEKALLQRAKKPKQTEIELWPESGEGREAFMDRCVIALTKCVGPKKAPGVCARKWRKSEKLGKKGLVTRAAIAASGDADLLIEPCGKTCIACEGADAPFLKAWDESEHPRVPAGSPDGGQFGHGGGGTEGAKPGKGKSKKPAKKEDFDKAKISFRKAGASGSAEGEAEFIAKWNEKIGIEPEEFKKTFLGGVDASMSIVDYGTKYDISGSIWGEGANKGAEVGSYNREIKIDAKEAFSAYFKLNKSTTKHDIGKKVLGGNVEMYEALGIESVGVTANIDVGGYAWAKYGYVPDQTSWNSLRGKLENKLTGGESSSRPSSDNTYEAEEWGMLSNDVQSDVRDRWMRDSYSEFLSSEEQNWRESGQAKDDAKHQLVNLYNEGGDIPEWAAEAFDGAREYREEKGQPPIPYTNKQLYDAITLDYESSGGDGEDDPEITFHDDKLQEPAGFDPAQQTLPGIEPVDPADLLTGDMRDRIERRMIAAFDAKAEEDAGEMDPPSYLADSISEYQDSYWDQKSDREMLQHAIDYDMANIEIEPDEDEEDEEDEDDGLGLDPDLFPPDEDPLLAAVRSSNPKSIWKIADSARGKELLLGTGWSGKLNLKDPESMKRFKEYVGRAAHG